MSIKTSKENICINQIIGQKEDNFIIEGDEIVPDIKPDVLNIISTNGIICMNNKEIKDGKVKFDGNIIIYTLYVADDENSSIRSIESNINFSKTVELETIKEGMQVDNKFEIKSIDCKILNGRKISLQASVKLSINIYSNENVEVIQDISDLDDIQKMNKSYNINSLVGNGSTKVYAKDTIQIDSSDNLSQIIKTDILVNNNETKISYNKVLIKADAHIKVVYLTDDNRVNSAVADIPIMGFIDIQNVNEENICDVSYNINNILIKPNNVEEHSIYVESEIELNCSVYENKNMEIIQDLYSPSMNLECSQNNIRVMQNKKNVKQTYNFRKQESIPDIGKNKICDVDVKPIIVNTKILNGKISYEGEMSLVFLYSSDSGFLASKTVIEPFNFDVVDDEVDLNTKITSQITVATHDFIVMPDETIDIKIDLDFNVNMSNMENINIITDVTESDINSKEKYSIVIYYTKNGDTLWNIAKRFGSTTDEIMKVNNMEDGNLISVGTQLFIPR